MIELLAFCPTRQAFIAGMVSTYLPSGTPLCGYDATTERRDDEGHPLPWTGILLPCPDLYIDEIGDLVQTEGRYEQGRVVVPPVIKQGHFVNLLAVGALADMLTQGLPQRDDQGVLKPLFERTHLLSLMPGLAWSAFSAAGEPDGYIGPHGVKLYDPLVINRRRRVWF